MMESIEAVSDKQNGLESNEEVQEVSKVSFRVLQLKELCCSIKEIVVKSVA